MAVKSQKGHSYQLQASVPSTKGKTRTQYEPPVLRDAEFNDIFAKLGHVSTVAGLIWMGTLSFACWAIILCLTAHNKEYEAVFYSQVPKGAYSWTFVAFMTTFALNFLALAFEHRTSESQVCAIACFIQILAGVHDLLCYYELSPVLKGPTGRAVPVLRSIMWVHTTPQMLYALSIMSELSRKQVWTLLMADVVMMLCGLAFDFTTGFMAVLIASVAWIPFPYIIYSIWQMFSPAIAQARHKTRLSLQIMRFATVTLWSSFPILWTLVELGLVSHPTDEICWCLFDFLGKAIFSTSLLHGNYATMEQRRLVAMTVVEEANRVAVVRELRELVARKDHFTAAVSHELRTPLNAIIGLSEALLSGSSGDLPAKTTADITAMHSTGQKLLMLVNNILTHADVQSVRLVIRPHKVDLYRLVDEIIDMTTPLASHGVQLINNLPVTLPHVLADGERILQVIYNLLSNACKFTSSGSIWVDQKVVGDKLLVSVHDTGVGMDSQQMASLFGEYEQVDMSTTRSYAGTGLGLCVVKQIVEAHDGQIDVVSEPRVGTTFTFSLKLWNEHDPNKNVLDSGDNGSATRLAQ